MTTMYARFTENNDAEGETWHYYIPVAGNEKALTSLEDLIDSRENQDDETYELDVTSIPEDTVDILLKYANGDTSYYDAHNKLSGVLVLTPAVTDYFTHDVGPDPFYKGDIREFVKAEA